MDKHNGVWPHDEILLGIKRRKHRYMQQHDETWKHHAKWKKPGTKDHLFYGTTYGTHSKSSKSVKIESRLVTA